MQTDAIVFTAVNTAFVQKVEMPPPAPDQVQVRTTYSAISAGTEGWIFQNLFTWQPTPYPCVPGYQRAGRIVAVGSDVKGWNVGDRCMATVAHVAGPVRAFWGSHAATGNSPVSEIYRIPDAVHDIDASAAVVANVGVNAASRIERLGGGEFVVVYGDGVIGQFGAEAARARGAKVILVGHRDRRLQLGLQHSADYTINNTTENVADAVNRITGGERVHAVIDTVQSVEVQREFVPLLEPTKGQIVYSGFTPDSTWSDQAQLQQQQLTTHYVAGWTRARIEQTLELMTAGFIKARPLVTHLVPFRRGPAMFDMILRKSEPFMGICLDWNGAE